MPPPFPCLYPVCRPDGRPSSARGRRLRQQERPHQRPTNPGDDAPVIPPYRRLRRHRYVRGRRSRRRRRQRRGSRRKRWNSQGRGQRRIGNGRRGRRSSRCGPRSRERQRGGVFGQAAAPEGAEDRQGSASDWAGWIRSGTGVNRLPHVFRNSRGGVGVSPFVCVCWCLYVSLCLRGMV